LDAIAVAEIERDLGGLAGDAMRGREAGTLDELRAAAWWVEQVRAAGLEPAGEDGSYLQIFPMWRTRAASTSRIAVNGTLLGLWTEALLAVPMDTSLDVPLVFVGDTAADALRGRDLSGSAVAAVLLPPTRPPAVGMSLRNWRWALAAVRERTQTLAALRPAAIVLVADSLTDEEIPRLGSSLARGSFAIDTGTTALLASQSPVILVRRSTLARVAASGARLSVRLATERVVYPSVNVVGRVRGSDPAVAGEYVLFSSHNDHDGVRWPVDGDSIMNGADDNASVSVGILAIGRAFAQAPGRRSALFVWHGAEEKGLLGSRWFVLHPTVPRDSIVAVLNADMIGRGPADTAALLGAQPPHRSSRALAGMALAANDRYTGFVVDSTWDRPDHPEGWYFRSDHLPYARAGIPAVYFSTLLHPDYHTPRDEVSRIDLTKLARMARWMYATGWAASNAAERPAVDPDFTLER
jgi:Peptidase family M28